MFWCEDPSTSPLCGLEAGKCYCVTVETIGYQKGDVYSAYLEGNFSELPTAEETAQPMERAKPQRITLSQTADETGALRISLPQTECRVDLVTVKL